MRLLPFKALAHEPLWPDHGALKFCAVDTRRFVFTKQQAAEIAYLFAQYYDVNVSDIGVYRFPYTPVIRFGYRLKYSMVIDYDGFIIHQIPKQYGNDPSGWALPHSPMNCNKPAFVSEELSVDEIERALKTLKMMEIIET